jgi:type I restriction enzyme, S subunit
MPDSWSDCTLSDVVRLQRGFDLPTSERRPGSVPILGSFGITGFHDTAAVTGPGVTIGRSGVSFGTATFCANDFWPLNTTLFVKDFRGNDARFVYYLLDAIDFSGYNSGSAQPSLNRNFIARLPVRIPDPAEQRLIAEVLGALYDKIECNLRMSRITEDLAVALTARRDGTVNASVIAEYYGRQIKVTDFGEGMVDHFSLPAFDAGALPEHCAGVSIKSNKLLLTEPVVLVSRLNPHIPRIWHAVPRTNYMALASTEFVALRPREGLASQELWAACAGDAFTSALLERVTGTTGSHQRVRPEDVLQVQVKDPRSAPEHIRAAVRELVDRAHIARQESVRLASLRDALLRPLLSGRLRVREVEALAGEAV